MKVSDIRRTFLKFYESKGHTIVASSPVVPGNDPTLLFTNAGMNQFKDVFLGFDKRSYCRATTSQKCIRAGGKHNDLDNVGYTARHHTFFEMLGNFSFGDYFKKDAISFAWELLTQHFHLPPEKLWVTVYAEDDEAYNIWHEQVGIPADRIVRIGDNKGARYMSDNFWMMGDTGPCGPCSEIFYDHGESVQGGPPGSPDEDGDRYMEIWNLVFMQFYRDEKGEMHKLPRPSIDTGMGLERIATVLQGVHSNYDIDLFQNLLAAAKAAVESVSETEADPTSPSLRVIADHIRACAFCVADGVIPGNEGRAYVLRRICRRAIRHGYKLGARGPFFYKLVDAVRKEMAEAYPELNNPEIPKVIEEEERRFLLTLSKGMEILDEAIAKNTDGVLDGELVFKLHDTYGFPADLTWDVCRERGLTVNTEEFDRAMERQRAAARASAKFKMSLGLAYSGADTVFTGYETLEEKGAEVIALYANGEPVEKVEAGSECVVVFNRTPFYAESGGQVGDQGEAKNATSILRVMDTFRVKAAVTGSACHVAEGSVSVGDRFDLSVAEERRRATERNHSVTHLMHFALRTVLGDHVAQKGSLVTPEATRFDFSYSRPVTPEQIAEVERIVNAEILRNVPVVTRVMPISEAKDTGAMMLFGERYGDTVRVLDIGKSREFCGGTHVRATGDIGLFKITSEQGIAAGVRRIEAVTGMNALAWVQHAEHLITATAHEFKAPVDEIPTKAADIINTVRTLEKGIEQLKSQMASKAGDALIEKAFEVKDARVLLARLDGADAKALRETMDKVKDKLGTAVAVLASAQPDGRVQLAAGVTKNLTGRIKAGELANFVAGLLGGKGGGKPDLAMAGAADASKLPEALNAARAWIEERL
ncbi:alanine--tRNA ligase [Sutterella sp.]|uniref:alanine--tRNA ligase n=1 Tax=Sutterella sp. TaxID=1981025 RepID=UPI0026DFB774|nr:alanine--tRNA ligase [Sutterella sp.]MDO5532034.1 alanine--tRNA ligase [Sutterella sp.]